KEQPRRSLLDIPCLQGRSRPDSMCLCWHWQLGLSSSPSAPICLRCRTRSCSPSACCWRSASCVSVYCRHASQLTDKYPSRNEPANRVCPPKAATPRQYHGKARHHRLLPPRTKVPPPSTPSSASATCCCRPVSIPRSGNTPR